MADRKLTISYLDIEGKSKTISYSAIRNEPGTSAVKALTVGLVSNGEIFNARPTTIKSAKIVETTENEIDLS